MVAGNWGTAMIAADDNGWHWVTSATTTGSTITVDASPVLSYLGPAKAEGAMEWLDRRIEEVRVRL